MVAVERTRTTVNVGGKDSTEKLYEPEVQGGASKGKAAEHVKLLALKKMNLSCWGIRKGALGQNPACGKLHCEFI